MPKPTRRKNLRLKSYDYSQNGYYFITVCTYNRKCLFGDIVGASLCGRPSNSNKMIEKWLLELKNKFCDIDIDEYIIMPNHIHFILKITHGFICTNGDHTGSTNGDHTGSTNGDHTGSPLLGNIIGWFKTMTTNEYIRNVKCGKYAPFDKHLWQRNYYEHIIRNKQEYIQISEYIVNNPLNWENDSEYTI